MLWNTKGNQPYRLCPDISSTLDHGIIIVLHLPDPILRDHLHQHTLEVHRQSPLQLIRAQSQDLHSLLEINVWVMMLVEDGKAVVSVENVALVLAFMNQSNIRRNTLCVTMCSIW